jgi:hypothetical protein
MISRSFEFRACQHHARLCEQFVASYISQTVANCQIRFARRSRDDERAKE